MTQYLNITKEKKGIATDRELAKVLEISPEYLRNIRDGKYTCNDTVAVRMAKLSQDDPCKVLLIAHHETADDLIKPAYCKMFNAIEQYNKKTKR